MGKLRDPETRALRRAWKALAVLTPRERWRCIQWMRERTDADMRREDVATALAEAGKEPR